MLRMLGRLSGSLFSTLAVCEPSSDSQSGSGLEADENAVADQLHQNAELKDPNDHSERGYGEARQALDLGVALPIPARHRPYCSGDHE